MTDFASLGIKIDSSQVPKAVSDLDKLTAAGTRAEVATTKLGSGSKAAAVGAAAFAAQAQASARGAVTMGTGATAASTAMQALGNHTRGSALQIRESLVLMREASVGNFTRMAGSASILAGSLATTGTSVGGLATRLLTMVGVLKVTQDAELSLAAADAAAGAAGIKAAADRARAGIIAADTQLALAEASVRVATTSEAAAAAQAEVALAHDAVAASAGEAVIAENALSVAMAREAEAATAAAAATTIALGPIAAVLAGVAIAAGLVVAGFKDLQAQARDSGVLDRFANSLGLSKKEMKELRQEVGGLSSKEMKDLDERARAFQITWGDVFHGLAKTASDALDLSPAWQKFMAGSRSAFEAALKHAAGFAAAAYGYVTGAYLTIVQTWDNFPNAIGHAFVGAINLAIGAINKLLKASTDALNSLINGVNPILDKVGLHIGTLDAKQIDAMKDSYGKAGVSAGKSFAQNVADQTSFAQKSIAKNVATIWDNIIGAAEKRIKGAADTIIEDRNAKKGKKQSDHGLADALAELDAQITGQLRLAAAYQVSDTAAIKAIALQKAEEQAIRHKGEIGVFYEKELALAVATRAADGGKLINQLSGETAARKAVNDAVSAGVLDAARAGDVLKDEAALRPLIAAQALAEGKAKAILADVIERLRGEQQKSNDEANRAQVLQASAAGNDQLEKLKLEATLISATNAVRAVAIAQLEAEQFLRDHPGASATEAQAYLDTQKGIAQQTADNATAQDNYNASLSYTHDLLVAIADQSSALGTILSDAFGGLGDSLGGALNALTQMQEQQQAIADWKDAETRKATVSATASDAEKAASATRLSQIETLANKASTTAQMKGYAGVISSVKSLFKEHSTAYKVMSAVEKAYALFQAAETIASIVRETTKTATVVANSATRTTAQTAEGGSKIFAELGPWAFPVVAAMVAVLAALGASGGGGGSSGPSIPTAGDIQDAAGTGTVLGSPKDKSASIANSLEIVAANTNKDLQYTNEMLRSLRSIDTSIAKLAGTVAQQVQLQGSLFDTSKLKLGTSGSKGFLGLIGGSTTTKSLFDLGINIAASTVGNIIANGITGQTYQIVQKIKTSSGFLGIGGGTKTSYTTTKGNIDPSITSAIQDVITSLRDGIVTAANVVGIQGAAAMLDGFQVAIGKISFKDLSGQEIEDQLNAIFSSIGDQMAGKVFPALTALQKVGEGLFETFIRVAKEYEAVDIELRSIGKVFGQIGVDSIAGRDALVQLFGSLEDFIDATDFFKDQFLSSAEQIAPVQASVVAEMQRLGLAGIVTRDQFKQTVLGLDLTTDAGRQMYASLLAVAPAFDKVLDYFADANKKIIEGLQSTADKFNGFATSLQKYRDTLFATDAAQAASYASLKAKFASTAALAATGDATALGGLEGAGKDFLTSAKNNASTWLQYQRDVALVARGVDKGIFAAKSVADYAQLQLDALNNVVTILGSIAQSTAATASVVTGQPVPTPAGVPSTPTGGGTNTQTVADAQTQADIQAALVSIATSNASIERLLKRFDRGDSLAITIDSDDPLPVNLRSWG